MTFRPLLFDLRRKKAETDRHTDLLRDRGGKKREGGSLFTRVPSGGKKEEEEEVEVERPFFTPEKSDLLAGERKIGERKESILCSFPKAGRTDGKILCVLFSFQLDTPGGEAYFQPPSN